MPAPQQRQCVLRNHQLFIGRHDVDGNAAVRAGYPRSVTGVLNRIKRHAEPFEPFRDPCPDAGGVFADPCGEDEAVETLQGSRQHSGVKRNAIDKIVDGESRTGIVCCPEARACHC